jgi:hypothetical protein
LQDLKTLEPHRLACKGVAGLEQQVRGHLPASLPCDLQESWKMTEMRMEQQSLPSAAAHPNPKGPSGKYEGSSHIFSAQQQSQPAIIVGMTPKQLGANRFQLEEL